MATYTSAQSGLWSSTATWVGGVVPPPNAGHKIVVATGHQVEYDLTGLNTYGDDTSTGVQLFGRLKMSRTVDTDFVCRGDLQVNLAGFLDMGSEADPILNVRSTLWLNDSATMGQQKWGLKFAAVNWGGFSIWGKDKTGFTYITAVAAANATFIEVADATDWQVGDILAFGGYVGMTSGQLTLNSSPRRIVSINGNTIEISGSLSSISHVGRVVENLSRNVQIRSVHGNTFRSDIRFAFPSNFSTANAIEVGPCEINLWGGGSGNNSAGMVTFDQQGGNTVAFLKKWKGPVLHTIWDVVGTTVTTLGSSGAGGLSCGISLVNTSAYTPVFDDTYFFSTLASNQGSFLLCQSANAVFNNAYGIRMAAVMNGFQGTGANNIVFNGGGFYSILASPLSGLCLGTTFNGTTFDGIQRVVDSANSNANWQFNQCNVGGLVGILDNTSSYVLATGGYHTMGFNNCTFSEDNLLARTSVRFNTIVDGTSVMFRNINNNVTKQQELRRGGILDRDNSVSLHGSSSLRLNCLYSGIPVTKSVSIPAGAGETIMVPGALRFNAAYLTATPPSVTISGLGITPVTFTAPATADAWHDFLLQATNPQAYAGSFTLTVSGMSAANSTAPFCWLDGVFVDDFVTQTRHYGYYFIASPKATLNPYITQSSAATVGAYSGIAIDHVNQVITLTETHTINELYDYCQWSLCQVANMGYAEFFTTADGKTFFSDYDLVIDGCQLTGAGDRSLSMVLDEVTFLNGGTVDIKVTDSTGTYVQIDVTGLTVGSRVQLYNQTDGVELANFIAASTDFTYYAKWVSNKTLRLRTNYVNGLDANFPEEQTTTFTVNGAAFISTPTVDTVYIENAIDGSLVTEFTADYPNVQIDISDPDMETSVQRLYAWFRNNTMSADGIRNYFGGMFADDAFNYKVVTSRADIKLDNTQSQPVIIKGARLYRDDGEAVIATTSGSIQMEPDKAYVASASSLAQGIWANEIENGLSAEQVMRVMLAVLAGKTDVQGQEVIFRDQADTKDRLVALMSASKRQSITIDAT